MTTKLAAFFRLTFLNSATTSRFLLLIFGGSCIDKVWMLLAMEELGLEPSLAFDFVGAVAILSACQFTVKQFPTSWPTFHILSLCDNVIWTRFCEIEQFRKQSSG